MNEPQGKDPCPTVAADNPSDSVAPAKPLQRIGRYRLERILGKGGFGLVYLAHDDQLNRPVAIKVAHANLIARPEDAGIYLTEARTVANLDHPNIVPVYDVGSTEDCPCFMVSKYIEGTTLVQTISADRPPVPEAAELVATIAEALHYAHKKGLVHRDIKPSNILLDGSGRPFVADFGLALKEEDVGKGPRHAGTTPYMSPEQARGEGHRVDPRSDLFSLGVVFYELLTGKRPFKGDTASEVLEQITNFEPRPPRQHDDAIPREIERICLKALSKRVSERYTTAKDMADDLRHFLAELHVDSQAATLNMPPAGAAGTPSAASTSSTKVTTPTSDSQPIKIIPKGLRSFDAQDADCFLELLPGPRDREGLPDSIRFWKSRIEETDPDNTFAVGLLYGPSGCGKSSLVQAGLLPRLAGSVIPIYVEATAPDTEARLLKGLDKRCPDLPANLDLIQALTALRRQRAVSAGKKVLIVLDQFEQWLHAKREQPNAELVQALQQCDGGRVQCIVLVRDDFWMAVTRFFRELDIRLVEGQNSAAVDLFDLDHARKVLAAFGRAFGKLPTGAGETSKEQKEFLRQAVQGLAQEGKVICVRLALFAEMMKGKAWTPTTWKEMGGAAGVGVTFLEETFSASTAPPEHRYHQNAARAVLRALLPESGTDIKGTMRSYAELLEASGYASHPKDFDDLIHILDGEIRLLTPTDPEGAEDFGSSRLHQKVGEQPGEAIPPSGEGGHEKRYYQLTHDYLVPALRDWLTRKQKETRRGRAELLLADRAAVWNARPENRQLPPLLQWLSIRWLTRKKNWTPPQRKMMRKATRFHVLRGLVLALVLAALSATGLMVRSQIVAESNAHHAAALVQRLLDAETPQVPGIVLEMEGFRHWTDALLREEYHKAKPNSRQQLHASLALLPVDATQVDYLYGRLLDAEPHALPVIRDALAAHQSELVDRLWSVARQPEKGKEHQRLRAAAALAKYDPDSRHWQQTIGPVVADLVGVNPVYLGTWNVALRPVKTHLLAHLAAIFRDPSGERAAERTLATNLLLDYVADQPQVLVDLLLDADEKQFAVIYPKFKDQGERDLPALIGEIDRKLPPDAEDDTKEKLAKRQATAAVALLKLNHPEQVWPLLKHSPDPRLRSYLIHRLAPFGADASAVVKRLDEEPDLTIRRALILSLGQFGEQALRPEERKLLTAKLQDLYRTAADPGLHAAVEWLLRSWNQDDWLKQVNREWAMDKAKRAKRLDGIKQLLTKGQEKTPPQWYVNGQGLTLVVLAGPVEFWMGSPPTEERRDNEGQHKKRIGRTFAIAATPVTKEQFLRFLPTFNPQAMWRYPEPTCPIGGVTWYQAAKYCNWLSEKEGIPETQWCYETTAKGKVMQLRKNYLRLTGYRLPTEAEWEYACRAGALTARSYGETEELLPHYGWYLKNSAERTWPVGSKKPNDWGLFDMHGNLRNWCQESYRAYPTVKEGESIEDNEDVLSIVETTPRVLRGGSFKAEALGVRSAFRMRIVPQNKLNNRGFRVARTILPALPLPAERGANLPRTIDFPIHDTSANRHRLDY